MKRFSFTELNHTPGVVLDEALKHPVVLTKRGKERLVVVTVEQWAELTKRNKDPRFAGRTAEMPPDLAAEVVRAGLKYLEEGDQ